MIPKFLENTLEIKIGERLTKTDYTEKFIPKVESMRRNKQKICLLVTIDPSFEGMDMATVWEDAYFGATHRHDFKKIVIVGKNNWMKW